jgi:hypothetical protein
LLISHVVAAAQGSKDEAKRELGAKYLGTVVFVQAVQRFSTGSQSEVIFAACKPIGAKL